MKRALGSGWLAAALWSLGCGILDEPAAVERQLIKPQEPSAEYYTTQPEGGTGALEARTGALGELRAEAATALAQARSALAMPAPPGGPKPRPPLIPDPRLAQLSRFVAEHWNTHGHAPQHAALDFVAHHLGLVEPAPHLALLEAPRHAIGDALTRELTALRQRDDYTHVGVYAEADGILGARAVVALSMRQVHLQPVPREVPQHHLVALRGQLRPGYLSPTLVVVAPNGDTDRLPIGDNNDFRHLLGLPLSGVYRVELLAEGPRGLTVVANFPIYAGVAIETQRTVTGVRADSGEPPESVRTQLLALLNDERRRSRRAPVVDDAALSAIAAAHNRDMLHGDYVGHTSPRTGSAADRVEAGGVHSAIVLENIGRAYGAQELHDGWMNSPGHRGNMLHPYVTHVGLAVTVTAQDDGPAQLLATMLLIRRVPRLAGDPVDHLRLAINREREQRGLAPLPLDRRLSTLCQAAAQRHFAQPDLDPEKNLAQLHRRGRRSSTEYQALKATLRVTAVLDLVAEEPRLLDADARGLGIGVSQGQRPGDVPNAIAVVLALGY